MKHPEDYFPLFTSPIWQQQKIYYQQKGAQAWNFVPFLYTSNKFMANWMADIIVNLAQTHPEENIQIVELGSGHAMFSYFLIQRLKQLKVDVTFTITDLIQSNLEYLQALPQWSELPVNWMVVDDINDLKQVADFNGVSFVIANYFYDSLPNVGYCKVDGEWQSAYLATKKKINKVEGMVDFDLSFISKSCEVPDSHKKLLDRYKDTVTHALIPEAVKQIMQLFNQSKKPTYFLANDKGYLEKEKMNYAANYAYNCDGAMATMVNFDAIKYWTEHEFDGFFVANDGASSDSHFAIFAINSNQVQQHQLVKMALSGAPWHTVFKLFMFFEEQPELSFDDACFYVEASHYDEAMLSRISGFIINQVKAHGELIAQLRPLLHKVMETYYWHPARIHYYYTMIDMLTLCNNYEAAMKLIVQYKHLVPAQYDLILREGVVFYRTKNYEKAQEKFEKALKIKPECKEAHRYLELME